MKYKLTVTICLIVFAMFFSACNFGRLNKQDKEEATKADTTLKEDKSNSNTINKQYESKKIHTWKSQDNLIEFVCDSEYGVDAWGIYSGYYNYQNQKYKLNVEITESPNQMIKFYYDADGSGVNYNVPDGESIDLGVEFLFGVVKHIDDKTFSLVIDGSGGNSETKNNLPFEIPYQYEDEIVFKMIQ